MDFPQSKRQRTREEPIIFAVDDIDGVMFLHNDPVVVSLAIFKYVKESWWIIECVKKILVDNESSANILFYDAFSWMGMPKDCLRWVNTPLISYSGDAIPIEGIVTLPMIAGQALK